MLTFVFLLDSVKLVWVNALVEGMAIPLLIFARKKKWGLIVWLPCVGLPLVLVAMLTAWMIWPRELVGNGTRMSPMQASLTDYFWLLFYGTFAFRSSLAVVMLTALFCWPRRVAWNKRGAIIGIIVIAGIVLTAISVAYYLKDPMNRDFNREGMH